MIATRFLSPEPTESLQTRYQSAWVHDYPLFSTSWKLSLFAFKSLLILSAPDVLCALPYNL